MTDPVLEPTSACRTDRHRLCGGYRCTCTCHGPDHDSGPPPLSWEQLIRGIFGDCISHQQEQVGACVYCVPCSRRLYQGTKMTDAELADLRAALAEAPDG